MSSIPDDAANHQIDIPVVKLHNVDHFVEVTIGDVTSPSKFFVQPRDQIPKLNRLMYKMNKFYSKAENDHYKMINYSGPWKGLFVAAIYQTGGWHRAQIMRKVQHDAVEVYFIDYGTVSVLVLQNLRFLRIKFCRLPQLAIRARLGGLIPVEESGHWSSVARAAFLALCQEALRPDKAGNAGGLLAIIMHKCRGDIYQAAGQRTLKSHAKNILDLALIDTYSNNEPNGKIFNKIFLEKEYATKDKCYLDASWRFNWEDILNLEDHHEPKGVEEDQCFTKLDFQQPNAKVYDWLETVGKPEQKIKKF